MGLIDWLGVRMNKKATVSRETPKLRMVTKGARGNAVEPRNSYEASAGLLYRLGIVQE